MFLVFAFGIFVLSFPFYFFVSLSALWCILLTALRYGAFWGRCCFSAFFWGCWERTSRSSAVFLVYPTLAVPSPNVRSRVRPSRSCVSPLFVERLRSFRFLFPVELYDFYSCFVCVAAWWSVDAECAWTCASRFVSFFRLPSVLAALFVPQFWIIFFVRPLPCVSGRSPRL